jgi:hypothetical protein
MKRRLVILAVMTLLTMGPSLAFAIGLQPIVPQDCNNSGGCSSICDIALAAQYALDDGIFIAIFLSAILFAWAGWQLIVGSSSGDPGKVKQAKSIFMYVTGGLVLIISAWLIVSVIMSALTNNPNWNAVCAS